MHKKLKLKNIDSLNIDIEAIERETQRQVNEIHPSKDNDSAALSALKSLQNIEIHNN